MSDKPTHDAGPDRTGSAGGGETTAASATAREPLVSGDPLGIGGVPDPDAPSRRPRPKIVSLVGEFFKMSRTTAVLLVSFVLLSMVYAAVKDEPVYTVGPRPVPSQVDVPPEQTPTPSSAEPTTGTLVPTPPTTTAPTEVATEDAETESRQTTTPNSDGQGNQTTQQVPQETQQQTPQQQQTQQQPQLQPQRVPQGTAAGPPGGGQTAE